MKTLSLVLIVITAGSAWAQNVSINFDKSSPQAVYAAKKLTAAFREQRYTVTHTKPDHTINLKVDNKALQKESFSLSPEKKVMAITGGDGTGLIYGALALAEEIRNGVRLAAVKAQRESSKLKFRGIKYDLPWDTYRHSYSLDQHQEVCSDTAYWRAFLDMMVENRFNTLSVWNLHPYTFMIKPKNFPEASPWSDSEIKQWKNLFGSIFRMARERGIETYVIPFNIFVTPEFARAHGVAMDNLDHHFFVRGDTSAIIKRYTRECVAQLLDEYPDLTGMGLTLGEGMGGMTPAQREAWMQETIVAGMGMAKRKSKLIHRIPFSSTTGSLGPTSIETERITRRGIEREADLDFIEDPVWADMKFNWSHAHSTPKLIKVHGGKLYGTYFDPVPEKYKVIWTARNEDFFCLRWGVPEFVRDHIRSNSQPYVGGYLIGSETYIPAKDYFTKDRSNVSWKYAFERQWLFYKTWGRLLYDHETPDQVFSAEAVRRYGQAGQAIFEAGVLAGKTPLRLASSFDCTWDFSLYSEGFMALNSAKKRVDYIDVDWLIRQPPLDPGYISIHEYVKVRSRGGEISSDKLTPPMLADMLEVDCRKAIDMLKSVNIDDTDGTLEQEVSDILTWANLGLHFSEKLRGAVALQTFRLQGGDDYKEKAIKHLENALGYWDQVIGITKPLYNEMPLVHLSEQDGKHWKENDHLRFHWSLLRDYVARDVETARNAIRE
jgi:hypothetical protein